MSLMSCKGIHIVTVVPKKKYVIFTDLYRALKFIKKENR